MNDAEQEDTTWDLNNAEDRAEWEHLHGRQLTDLDPHTCHLAPSGDERSWTCGACEQQALKRVADLWRRAPKADEHWNYLNRMEQQEKERGT